MNQTQFPQTKELLDQLLTQMHEVLGEKLVGLYLYGSLVWGDFDLDTSDIDLLAVLSSDVTEKEITSLDTMHHALIETFKEWEDRIEVQYVSTKALSSFKSGNNVMATISPGEPLHIVDYVEKYLMNFYFVQEQGEVLFGPDPKILIQPVTNKEFIQQIKKDVQSWKTHIENTKHSRPYQGFAIMTLCRAMYTSTYGEQVSKRKAADWVKSKFPQWETLINNSFVWRKNFREKVENPEDTYPETKKFVYFIIDQIQS